MLQIVSCVSKSPISQVGLSWELKHISGVLLREAFSRVMISIQRIPPYDSHILPQEAELTLKSYRNSMGIWRTTWSKEIDDR